MKKLFICMCLFLTLVTNTSYGKGGINCCAIMIIESFNTTAGNLYSLLIAQFNSLNSLERAINKHNKTLDKQNVELNKKLNLLKEENLRNREFLFYLQKKVNLQ